MMMKFNFKFVFKKLPNQINKHLEQRMSVPNSEIATNGTRSLAVLRRTKQLSLDSLTKKTEIY